MQFTSFIVTALFVGASIAVPSPDTSIAERSLGLCKPPNCTSRCPDGAKFNCCVTYIRDPCSDHQVCGWDDCLCKCPASEITFFCNAKYLVDPCKKWEVLS
ncbi:hypothetical protein BJ875DRAFT_168248 [Amylocarpus encephaloides]|uniref:Uncharacterized protein n=1 Tax=Amylocarpus encephaloides TaxID=45428 RepID=A0A9P7YPC4_9HELO|nr:hypothetical protein BJ875DRAFT_168248 [Amylocarpus encephaloides]